MKATRFQTVYKTQNDQINNNNSDYSQRSGIPYYQQALATTVVESTQPFQQQQGDDDKKNYDGFNKNISRINFNSMVVHGLLTWCTGSG